VTGWKVALKESRRNGIAFCLIAVLRITSERDREVKIVDEGHSTLALRRRLSSSRIAAASSWVIPMTRALSGEVLRARLAIHSWCSLEVFCIVVTPGCRKPQDRTVEATRLEMLEKTFGTVCKKPMPRELKYFRNTFSSLAT